MSEPQVNHDSGSQAVQQIRVAFWNLQNLFDIEISAIAADLEFTPVNGWDRNAFESKVRNLAEVIRLMFDGHGPDLLGICEIENERVAKRLISEIGRDDYQLAHIEHPDIRGIDTSLIYSDKVFTADPARMKGHLVHLRFPTRDIFEVPLTVNANQSELAVLVNHWPSRSNGKWLSEPFRMTVASHCGRIVDELVKIPRRQYLELQDTDVSLFRLNDAWDSNVLIMGDLNDEPWDRSVLEILGAAHSTDHLEESIRMTRGTLPSYKSYAARPASLFNPMWSLMTTPDQGTYYFSQSTQTMNMLDQFIVSRGLYYGRRGLMLATNAAGAPDVQIFRPEIMTTRKGRPREFRLDNHSGYSDHFPITTTLNVLNNPDAT